jgi:hypothetical protein
MDDITGPVPRPFRFRLKAAWRALKGDDVLFDVGTKRTTPEGRMYILGKSSLAVWVETVDPVFAQAQTCALIEKAYGHPIDWESTAPEFEEKLERLREADRV